jgi:putative transposase
MPQYRRAFVPGGTFFFTVVTENRAPLLSDARARLCLRRAFTECRGRWPFAVDAFVLLPDHLHTIWTLPPGDSDFSRRWGFLKKEFSQMWIAGGGYEQARSASRVHQRRRGVLQRRFWEHAIRNEDDLKRHLDYIHYNPVKHGLVTCPHAWPHSTFHRFVREDMYAGGWCCQCESRMPTPPRFNDLDETAME